MAAVVELADPDRPRIEAFFRRDTQRHVYELGDLDPFFWPHTQWFGWERAGELDSVCLLYTGSEVPTLLALSESAGPLLKAVANRLPARFYAHLATAHLGLLGSSFKSHGTHLKMTLTDAPRVQETDTHGVESFGGADLPELTDLYAQHYPGNWFVSRMLETQQYFGIRIDGQIVAAAGVHVYSPSLSVAALGNVATHSSFRRQGLARKAVAKLCQSLLASVDCVCLNVAADNTAAIACYEQLGFETTSEYEEVMVERSL